jgi:hypothetical protein
MEQRRGRTLLRLTQPMGGQQIGFEIRWDDLFGESLSALLRQALDAGPVQRNNHQVRRWVGFPGIHAITWWFKNRLRFLSIRAHEGGQSAIQFLQALPGAAFE